MNTRFHNARESKQHILSISIMSIGMHLHAPDAEYKLHAQYSSANCHVVRVLENVEMTKCSENDREI